MKVFLAMILSLSFTAIFARADFDLGACEARYKKVAGPYLRPFKKFSSDDSLNLFPTVDNYHPDHLCEAALLSYAGQNAITYDNSRFGNCPGVLPLSIQEVMGSSVADEVNAGLVYEFLTSADNDTDYPEVQLMALQLQPTFPNVQLDDVLYWIVSANPNWGKKMDLQFCIEERQWTWLEIQNWFANTAIPQFLEAHKELIKNKALCRKIVESGDTVLDCHSK